MENIQDLQSGKMSPEHSAATRGEDFRVVLEELIKIVEPTATVPAAPKGGWPYADAYMGDGWSLAYRVFDAQFWGVPQRRRRIYLVADFAGGCAPRILFEREGLRGYPSPGGSARQGAAAYAQGSIGADDREGNCLTPLEALGLDGYNSALTGDVAATLGVNCGISTRRNGVVVAAGFKAGQSMAGSIGYQEECAATLSAQSSGTEPTVCVAFAQNQRNEVRDLNNVAGSLAAEPGMKQQTFAAIRTHLFENHSQDARYRGPLDVCPMLPAQLGTGGNNQPFVLEECIPIHDQETRFAGKRGDKSDGKGNGLGVGDVGDPMNTLTGGDRHAVAYCIGNGQLNQISMSEQSNTLDCMHDKQAVLVFDKEVYNSGKNATGGHYIAEDGPAPSLRTAHPLGVCLRYIVRRLTPTECARLQGFPDDWGHPDPKEDFADEDYRFWLTVRNTHAEINGKTVKDYTKAQMLKWYNKLHSNSSEYKMWGNGIALPCALYVMEGFLSV